MAAWGKKECSKNQDFIREILKKYSCQTEPNESISNMSSDSMASKIAVFKAHAFSKANTGDADANSVPRNGRVHSTNTRPIYSPGPFPGGELNLNEQQTAAPGKVQEIISLFNRAGISNLQHTPNYCEELAEGAKRLPSSHGSSSNINSGQNSGEQIQREGDLRPPFLAAKAGKLQEDTDEQDSFLGSKGLSNKISETPKVIITPAADMEEENDKDPPKPAETNGEVVSYLLNERTTSESDSLSSASSSVDEFLTDEEGTDEELGTTCNDEKPCKVRNYSC